MIYNSPELMSVFYYIHLLDLLILVLLQLKGHMWFIFLFLDFVCNFDLTDSENLEFILNIGLFTIMNQSQIHKMT